MMKPETKAFMIDVCREYGSDRTRLMDIVRRIQEKERHVSLEAMELLAEELGIDAVEVRSLVSFYSFFSETPQGKIVIRVCNDVVDLMHDGAAVSRAFEAALGILVGQTTADGQFSLEHTPCIGMCDQAPAVLINNVVCTRLTAAQVPRMVETLKRTGDPQDLVTKYGAGNNSDELVRAMVENSIRRKGEILLAPREAEAGLRKASVMQPQEVVQVIKDSRLRGRGGAGFPTGMKWDFTRKAAGSRKILICNADEGEPGTFKDRVLLTEKFDLLCEGMAIAGYAIGAREGIMYLRAEYAYLEAFLESILAKRRREGLLGSDILGKQGFDFDIRIQMGGGAYICGEEGALISSCEGLRGDPKTRPPFPAQKGYLGCPTSVNNVETLCAVACILERGSDAYGAIGTPGSTGTKLLSVSGDCEWPGVYEFPFGVSINEILQECDAADAQAVLVGGPSGTFLDPSQFDRTICFDDLSTGGAVVVFGPHRNLLRIAGQYLDFFIEESCGYCTPCRAGTVLMKQRLEDVLAGRGNESDLDYLAELGRTIRSTSRCGLGQTACNPVLTTIANFRPLYNAVQKAPDANFKASFDIHRALRDHEALAGRTSEIFPHDN
jgi:[NiFe] hydrogenase diaphorase moiety large subunit